MTPQQLIDSNDEIITEVDINHLVIEDETPVDNFQSEKQQRLLVEPLYSSQVIPPPFLAAANVGLFYQFKMDPVVPDVLLSLGVQVSDDLKQKRNRSYFVWELGKLPEVCIEIVSNQEGNELTLSEKGRRQGKLSKKDIYRQIPINYYVVFDPLEQIQDKANMDDGLLRVWRYWENRYIEITPSQGISGVGESIWLEEVGLGLTLWSGQFEEQLTRTWLRWCGNDGQVVPTGAEATKFQRQQAEFQRQQAEFQRQQAELANQQAEFQRQQAELANQQAEFQRQQAESANQQAEFQRQQAELANQQAKFQRQQAELANQQAELANQRAEQLAARLIALGISPD